MILLHSQYTITICVIKKIEKLKEIDFPSSNKHQKNVNCIEYIYNYKLN